MLAVLIRHFAAAEHTAQQRFPGRLDIPDASVIPLKKAINTY